MLLVLPNYQKKDRDDEKQIEMHGQRMKPNSVGS